MVKDFIPPFFLRFISSFFYGWSGNYATWAEAQEKCTGYDSDVIFQKVKSSLLKVKNGDAVFERDSVLFDKIQYSFPLLAALNNVALNTKGALNVLDFGGSLGSGYYQNKNFFNKINEFNWCIVEQTHFVNEGKKNFQNNQLHFYDDIETCLKDYKINIVVLASVLQYIEKPYELLNTIIKQNIEYIYIDRTPVLIDKSDRITIQKVHKSIYEAKYPCWLLNEKKILHLLSYDYELLFDAESAEQININGGKLKGYFLKRKLN